MGVLLPKLFESQDTSPLLLISWPEAVRLIFREFLCSVAHLFRICRILGWLFADAIVFSGAFKRGDREILPSFAALAQLQSFVVSGKATDPSKSLQELTKKISQTPISANSNPELANAAVSSLVQGNNLRAFEATDIVLQRDPKDPWAPLNRARLFAQIGTDVRATVEQLQQSRHPLLRKRVLILSKLSTANWLTTNCMLTLPPAIRRQ